jgi:hypothetical protein
MTRDRPNRDSRQTVTAAKKPYPGDDLVPDATMVIDRYLDFDAPRDQVWPWLLQLGKRRAGWYLPRLVELFVPRRHRASRVLLPQFQHLVTGMDVPDWGPGDPVFRVAELEPGRAIVYLSLRERTAGPPGAAAGHRRPCARSGAGGPGGPPRRQPRPWRTRAELGVVPARRSRAVRERHQGAYPAAVRAVRNPVPEGV